MAGLAGSQPTPGHINQTFRAASRKEGEQGMHKPDPQMLLVIQATAAHWVMLCEQSAGEALGLVLTKSSSCKLTHAIWTANCP